MSVVVANTSSGLSGKTLLKAEDAQTITGLKLFDLGASAPMAIVSGAAKVTNLDADKLDGAEGTAYHDAAQLTGVMPVTVIGADPNADRVAFWDDSANAYAFLELLGLAIRGTQLVLTRGVPCGRLTLTTALPVTSADVTAATTLFYALYSGNQIALYNGTTWENFIIAELSIAVPGTTATMYDVFVDYNAGTPALTVTAWTNLTTRATALTRQDGVLVLTGTLGKLFVGSFCTTAVSGQTEDSLANRLVWNNYNRVMRPMRVIETTDTWNYSTATWRQARATTTNQLGVVVGVAEGGIEVSVFSDAFNSATGAAPASGVGFDSTTAPAAGCRMVRGAAPALNISAISLASFHTIPAIGSHTFVWLEIDNTGSGTTSWVGDNGSTVQQSGIAATGWAA